MELVLDGRLDFPRWLSSKTGGNAAFLSIASLNEASEPTAMGRIARGQSQWTYLESLHHWQTGRPCARCQQRQLVPVHPSTEPT